MARAVARDAQLRYRGWGAQLTPGQFASVKLTPTPKDNEAVEFVYKIIEYVAGIFSPKAKE